MTTAADSRRRSMEVTSAAFAPIMSMFAQMQGAAASTSIFPTRPLQIYVGEDVCRYMEEKMPRQAAKYLDGDMVQFIVDYTYDVSKHPGIADIPEDLSGEDIVIELLQGGSPP